MAVGEELREQLDLSGPWQLAFDPLGEGIRRGWPRGSWPATSECVQVPALWNVTHPDAEGVGFYRRVFAVPSRRQGQVQRLHFGGASYRAEVWLNGTYLGSHEGAYTPFSFDVTPVVRAGAENELVVRVASLAKGHEVDGMALAQCPASKQSWYYTHGGLWGPVYLEALASLSCQAITAVPDLAGERVLAEVVVANAEAESRLDLRLEVTGPDGAVAAEQRSSLSVPPGLSRLSYRLALPRPMLWDCRHPHLYRLAACLAADGQPADRFAVRFGMREFTVKEGQFLLNGEPIFLQGLLLQPDYPITGIVPPTREMMVREIALAKEAGFNLIRAHIRPTPPGYLDLTDEMGMLVYAESCLAWIKDSPRLLDHGRRELTAMIERDRNHPSVVFWGIYNENRAASAQTSDALIRTVRALDPTRVIVDNSGGTMAIDQDFGWVDRTTVVPAGSTRREAIQDLHIYVGAPIPAPVYEWMRTLGTSDPPADLAAHDFGSRPILEELSRELRHYRGQVLVSELGCGGMADLDEVVAGFGGHEDLRDAREIRAFRDSLYEGFAVRHLDRVFGSVRELIRASQALQAAGLVRQVEALLANRRLSGYCITQLNDVAWEFHAGLLDHWRNPKPAYEAMKRLHRPHAVILKSPSPVVACGERTPVALTLVSREPLRGTEQVRITALGPGREAEALSYAVPAGAGIQTLGVVPVQTGEAPGEWRVWARLMQGGETLAESAEAILALPPVDLAGVLGAVECLGEAPGESPHREREHPHSIAEVQRQSGESPEPPLLLAACPSTLTESDWARLLDGVAGGRTAIVGPLHRRDVLALRVLGEHGIPLRLHYGIGNWMGCYHWLRAAELLPDLPASGLLGGGLAGEAYVDVLPWYVMSELGGQVLAGSLRNTQTRREPPAILWYSDIEAIPFGQGALVFCQYRLFDRAHAHPLAGALARSLIRLAQEGLTAGRPGIARGLDKDRVS